MVMLIVAGILSLFYYANLIPIHVDEAGYWFNFTSKSIENRNIHNQQVPNHTLAIYGAKLSLKFFGNNGIGYRFPAILFSLLSAGALFCFVRQLSKSNFKAILAVGLLLLCPWYLHYSHELRGYTSLLFFALIAFISLDKFLTKGNEPSLWALMLIAFIGSYYSSLGSVVFIFNFMATLWILKIAQYLMPSNQHLIPFEKISFRSFFIFSLVATAIMTFIIFYLDINLISENRGSQKIIDSRPFLVLGWTAAFTMAADVFSTFLGYRYLGDPASLLYNYPLPIWIFSLICVFYGLKKALDSKQTLSLIFITLYTTTFLFNFLNQYYLITGSYPVVPIRVMCYFLPFLVIFQAIGLIELIRVFIEKAHLNNFKQEALYGVIAGILLIYFLIQTTGKYQNLEASSGNPYERVKSYLINETDSRDLIISGLKDTVAGFYLGEIIRSHTLNIFNDDRLENIIYLTTNPAEKEILLKNYYLETKKWVSLSQFSKVAHFANHGVRGDKIFVYKSAPNKDKQVVNLKQGILENMDFVGDDGKLCKKEIKGESLKLFCYGTLACVQNEITFSDLDVSKSHYQLVIFRNTKNRGSRYLSMAIINRPERSKGGYSISDSFFSTTHYINPLVDHLDDLDRYRENIVTLSPSLQQFKLKKDLVLCMSGDLFQGNTKINGIKIYNFKF